MTLMEKIAQEAVKSSVDGLWPSEQEKIIRRAIADAIRETGAEEALDRCREFLQECEVAEDRSNLDGDDCETVLQQINEGAETGLPQVNAALTQIRALTETNKETKE
jgi:hypothetical protein